MKWHPVLIASTDGSRFKSGRITNRISLTTWTEGSTGQEKLSLDIRARSGFAGAPALALSCPDLVAGCMRTGTPTTDKLSVLKNGSAFFQSLLPRRGDLSRSFGLVERCSVSPIEIVNY